MTCFLFAFVRAGTSASSIDGCRDEMHGVRLTQGRSSGWGLWSVFELLTFQVFSVAGL